MEAARHPTTAPAQPVALAATETIANGVSYWLAIGGVYVLEGFLWYYSFKEKIFDDNAKAPPPIRQQFDGTIVDSFPGTSAAWAILGILEGLIFLGVVLSLVTGEFLPHRRKPILFSALALALLTFALMAFGETLTKQFDSVASLYTYFGATVVIMFLLLTMPPYRAMRWLSRW
jgi:hypothetical protein